MTDDTSFAQEERRRHHAVRGIFPQACVLLAPLVKANDKTLNASGFAMLNMVRNHFSELSASDAYIVVTAVERLHRESRLQPLFEEYAGVAKT